MAWTAYEEIASFAGFAHAEFTGTGMVCMAPSDHSTLHLLDGLYDANLDHQPVAAIIGRQKRMAMGGRSQQESENDTRRSGLKA